MITCKDRVVVTYLLHLVFVIRPTNQFKFKLSHFLRTICMYGLAVTETGTHYDKAVKWQSYKTIDINHDRQNYIFINA